MSIVTSNARFQDGDLLYIYPPDLLIFVENYVKMTYLTIIPVILIAQKIS